MNVPTVELIEGGCLPAMKANDLYMVFDVESVGLHGEGFSVGYVVMDDGQEVEAGYFWTHPDNAAGTRASYDWVMENIGPSMEQTAGSLYANLVPHKGTRDVREAFWQRWMGWKGQGAVLAADCPWPVEARFLIQCIGDDAAAREWSGPYPLIDVASVRLAAGLDPLGTNDRIEREKPAHHPTADARQSARLLLEALAVTRPA